MKSNQLKLNDLKTEFIIIGSPSALKKVKTEFITIGGHRIPRSTCVRNIGAYLDQHMSMDTQISHMCKAAWLNLFKIGKIRHYLTTDQAKTLVHAHVTSRLDQFNTLLCDLPDAKLDKLRRVQFAAARLITGTKKFEHITPVLRDLHWLSTRSRINFKLLLLAFKALASSYPVYIKDLLEPYVPRRHLRSSDSSQLTVPRSKTVRYGDRAFSVAVPKLWNSLPLDVRTCSTVPAFKKALKTHLFKLDYC